MSQIIDYEIFLRERKKYNLPTILFPEVTENTVISGDSVDKVLEEISGGPYTLDTQRLASWKRHTKVSNILDYLTFLDEVKEICRTLCPT